MSTKYNIYIVIFSSFVFVIFGNKNSLIKLVKTECFPNDDLTFNVSCHVRPYSRIISKLTVLFLLKKQIDDFHMKIELYRKSDSLNYRPFLVNVSGIYCSLTTNEKNPFFFFFLQKFINRFMAGEHQCPFKKQVFIKDLYPNASRLPVPALTGEYRMDFSFAELKTRKKVIKISLFGFAQNTE